MNKEPVGFQRGFNLGPIISSLSDLLWLVDNSEHKCFLCRSIEVAIGKNMWLIF